MPKRAVHIGCGAGFAGDRTDAAGPVVDTLISEGAPSFLIFETLAERTLAQAQLRNNSHGGTGYLPSMLAFVGPVLERCLRNGIRIVGNFGAADPLGAAKALRSLMDQAGFSDKSIGVVLGDNLLESLSPDDIRQWPLEGAAQDLSSAKVVAANAYLGAEPIAEALNLGAQIVVTGRVADPSLTLGPLVHHFNWSWTDWDRLAGGTLAGHLLECGAQVTGGYFADPGVKDVPGLADLGYPIAEVMEDGSMVLGKAKGTGGMVSLATVKEQILYEIHDPSAYLTPDVILDITEVQISQQSPDRVAISGARGRTRPDRLKTTICMAGGWMGEGEISYAGPNAFRRAELAIEILKARVRKLDPSIPAHFDIIGYSSIFSGSTGLHQPVTNRVNAQDVRVRLATRGVDRKLVERTVAEVEALYTTGPAGGGGVRLHVTENLDTASCLIDRDLTVPRVKLI
jgi:hypothetical protein